MRDLSGYFAQQLSAAGGAPAVIGQTTLTYDDLAERVEAVVQSVKPHVVPGDVIALDMRSPALGLMSILAADRLGVAFLPVDTTAPPARQKWVIESSAARVVLQESGPLTLEACPRSPNRPPWPLADPGYVIYTSGTTGQPKGVHVPKQAHIDRLEGLRQLPGFDSGGSFLALSALSFDMSMVEVVLPLVAGGPIVTVDLAARRDVAVFDQVVREHRPDVVQATPSFWRLMLASGWSGSHELTVWCGGEAMTPELADALHERCGVLWNLYGPTEATIWASAWRVVPGQPISLGTELPGTTLELVDPDGVVATGNGVEGEIRIRGAGIADGYLVADPSENAPFHSTPGVRSYLTGDRARRGDDSSLTFLGRLDNQVKVRGHRVELGEIESTLEAHPAIVEAVVVLLDQGDPDTAHLRAVIVTRDAVKVRELRRWLMDRLPAAMIPKAFQLEAAALPRTTAGKLDRVAITQRLAAGGPPS